MRLTALLFAVLSAAFPNATAQTAPFTITTVFPFGNTSAVGMRNPSGVAIDPAGNLYVSDWQGNQVFRRTPSGVITVVAGTGESGFSGDGGQASAAKLHNPTGLAIDASGNLFVVDTDNYRIRRIDTSGIINTVAGNATWSSYPPGDGMTAISAGLDPSTSSVAVDPTGNLYYTYSGADEVLQVNPAGIVHRVMGPGLGPNLTGPNAVVSDNQGNLWVSDDVNIYERAASGAITKLFHLPNATGANLAVSAAKGVCYTTSFQINCIDASGQSRVIAGTGLPGLSGEGGPAVLAALNLPNGMAFDSMGNLYFADSGNDRIRKIDGAGIISTVIKGTIAISPQLLKHVATDAAGNLYISDELASVVWKLTPAGIVSVFAGTGVRGFGGDGDVATDSTLFAPEGLAVDASGNLYITEIGDSAYRIRKVTPEGIIHAFAGTGKQGWSGDGGPARDATLYTPMDVAVDAAGNVFIADTYNNRIRKVNPDGVITTVAGFGTGAGWLTSIPGGDGGLAINAQLCNPQGLAIDAAGDVYTVDSFSRVRKIRPGGIIETVAGITLGAAGPDFGGCDSYPKDGPALSVTFCNPSALAFAPSGDLYIAEVGRVARIDAMGMVSTFAGTGVTGFTGGDNGPATAAQLSTPWGMAFDGSGAMYVVDTGNTRIRRISAGTPCNVALSSALRTLDSSSANGSFTVTASLSCAYTANTDSSWIHINSGAAGQASGTVQYSVDLNAGGSGRNGAITVSTNGATAVFGIDQAGTGCQFTLNPAVVSVGYWAIFDPFSYTVRAPQTSDCTAWDATSDSAWVQITRAAVSVGVPSLDYVVDNNPTGQTRTAVLTIGNQTHTIIQDASPIVVTSPSPGSTLTSTTQQFNWTASDADEFMYQVSATPGAADIASGFVFGGSVKVTGLPRASTIYFRLLYSLGGEWQPAPIDVVYKTAAGGYSAPLGEDFSGTGRSGAILYDALTGTTYTALSNGDGTYQYVYNLVTTAFDTLRTGDFNGDRKADLILYNSKSGLAYIGLSNGDGTFAYQSLFWSPGYDFVVTGDLNGDSKTDIALYNSTNGTMYTGISDGMGGFTYKYSLISLGFTFGRLADFTGDGKADLFVYNSHTGAAYLGIGDGTGSFQFHPLFVSPGYDLADVGDLNADGKADLILYNSANGNAATGISDGLGGFTFTPQLFSPGFTSVRLADYTGDGKADVTVYNKSTGAAYFGTGNGTGSLSFQSLFWSPGYDFVQPEDVDGDGKTDIVLYNSTIGTAYTGISNGAGGFAYTYSYWGPGKALAR